MILLLFSSLLSRYLYYILPFQPSSTSSRIPQARRGLRLGTLEMGWDGMAMLQWRCMYISIYSFFFFFFYFWPAQPGEMGLGCFISM